MADASRSIEDILAALAQQRSAAPAAPAPQPTPPAAAATYPPPPAPAATGQYSMPAGMTYPPASYAPGAYPTGSYAPPNTYAPPAAAQSAAGGVDLSAIKPVSSGTVSIEDAIKHAKAIAAKKGVVPYDRSAASYNDHASAGGYVRSRSSRSRSPQPRRDAYRDNYNAYRDERRDGQRDYGRERSYSPGPRGRPFSPRGSSGNARDRSPLRGNDDSETIEIESSLVGLIIGRQGENLRRVESETGCRVQFLTPPGDSTPYRQCKITGPRSRRADAKTAINRIIEDSGMGAIARAGLDKGPDARNVRESEDSTQIMVPDRTVGLIIGRGGETIRDLQERSGCHINIVGESKSVNGLRPVNLIGHPDCTQKAKNLIMEIVDSDTRNAAAGGGGGGGGGSGGGSGANRNKPDNRDQGHEKINDSIYVPSEAVGMIIGKGGETIREMQNVTGCKINVSQSSGPGEVEREIGLVGTRDAINKAKRAIEDKVETVMQRVRNGGSSGRNNNRQRNDDYDRSQSNYNRSDNSASAAAPPTGAAAGGATTGAADPYAAYGGYQNYVALWYQALAAQGGAVPGQAPDASKPTAS